MAKVSYQAATRTFPKADHPAVNRLDLEIEDGEFLVFVGPSGCGKSTSLRMLAGLEEVDEGAICINGVDVTDVPPKARDIAMVFQNYALYPHMTVGDNMGFALKIAGVSKVDIKTRVAEAARLLELELYLDRKPKTLSGGQRQRVAMGRAIVRKPQVFLMDEPLSNLDAKLRVSTRTEISSLQRRLGTTTVYVTHDQTEAMTMGDRVAVLKDGLLQQVDTPLGLYEKPANPFVAGFIGSPGMNIIKASRTPDGLAFGQLSLPVKAPRTTTTLNGEMSVGFRPESLEMVGEGQGFPVVVNVIEQLGSEAFLYATLAAPAEGDLVHSHDIVARVDPRNVPRKGQTVQLRIRPSEVHLFDSAGGRIN